MLSKARIRIKKIPTSVKLAVTFLIVFWSISILFAIETEFYYVLFYVAAISLIPIIVVLIYEIRKENIRTREERKEQTEAEYKEQLIQTTYSGKQRNLEEIRGGFTKENLERISVLKIDRNKKKEQICTIGRLPILEGHEILQCPQCKNYFCEINLLIWLEKKKQCPVCKAQLIP